jgi:hypothetical protein
MKHRAIILVLLATFALACRPSKMPPTPTPSPARARMLVQKQFRLGTLDFGGSEIGDALPAMLLTELRALGRFSVKEGGGIRTGRGDASLGAALSEKTASEYVDGYLSGTITSRDAQQVCFDVRLSNAVNHEVLFAKSTCAPLQSAADTMLPDRDAIKRLADEITRAIKQVGHGKVTAVDGELVFIDKGADADVMPGMVAYVVGTGDSVSEPAIHMSVKDYTGIDPAQLVGAATPVVVGTVYIASVEKEYSVGLLFLGDYALPGDTVFFK